METFTFTASDGMDIYCYKWMPTGEPKAAFQLTHGLIEHAMRYAHFAERLTREGFVVYSMDLRGHGKTAAESAFPDLFSKQSQGWDLAVDDLQKLTKRIQQDHPGIPIYLFGHSMGSFLVRDAISVHGDAYQGVLLSGTGSASPFLIYLGLVIANLLTLTGRGRRSKLLHYLSFGNLNDQMENPRTEYDFLTRDSAIVDAYIADPWCGKTISVDFGVQLVTGLLKNNRSSAYQNTPEELPIYLFSGGDDPVSGEDSGFLHDVARSYKDAGVKDVTLKIYPGARHEILNEINREDVMDDVVDWLNKHLNT